jgi:hypothetical protein
MLAWFYFFGEKEPPELFTLIEDRDLWNWNYRERSEPLHYALKSRINSIDFALMEKYTD